jgi:hypothetical protein
LFTDCRLRGMALKARKNGRGCGVSGVGGYID